MTAASAVGVKRQVFVLLPPLEQAPDQMASRPFVTLSVIVVPFAKEALAVLPTATLIPVGLDVTRSPPRPVAVTVSINVPLGGGGGGDDCGVTVNVAARLAPPNVAVIVNAVEVVTGFVVTVKLALVAPAATVTLAGTLAAAVLLLKSVIDTPPDGAAPLRVTLPCAEFPPTTEAGLSVSAESAGVPGGGGGEDRTVKLRTADHGPPVPDELTPRTRHQSLFAGRELAVNRERLTVALATSGEGNELASSICIW